MFKIGFIGFGNMAQAILGGILKNKLVAPSNIFVYDPVANKKNIQAQYGITFCENNKQVICGVDVCFLCVKPNSFTAILGEISSKITTSKTLVSIAAGITIQNMAQSVGTDIPIIRTMPNTPLLLGKGTTALCHNGLVTPDTFSFVKNIFSGAGTVYELPEHQFNHVINLNGSSPAYVYLFAKTVAEYAQEQGGIPFTTSLSMFCDTLCGAAAMLTESGKSPDELIQNVSSPGGTTVAALQAFNENGFVESLQAGLEACVNRAEEMGK